MFSVVTSPLSHILTVSVLTSPLSHVLVFSVLTPLLCGSLRTCPARRCEMPAHGLQAVPALTTVPHRPSWNRLPHWCTLISLKQNLTAREQNPLAPAPARAITSSFHFKQPSPEWMWVLASWNTLRKLTLVSLTTFFLKGHYAFPDMSYNVWMCARSVLYDFLRSVCIIPIHFLYSMEQGLSKVGHASVWDTLVLTEPHRRTALNSRGQLCLCVCSPPPHPFLSKMGNTFGPNQTDACTVQYVYAYAAVTSGCVLPLCCYMTENEAFVKPRITSAHMSVSTCLCHSKRKLV